MSFELLYNYDYSNALELIFMNNIQRGSTAAYERLAELA